MSTRISPGLPLAGLLFLSVFFFNACGDSGPSGPELWIIGLDGADWDQLDPLIAQGELPNLAALREGGASGILLSDRPMISPILWTSISTGKTPDLHGVTWFMSDGPDGSKVPVSSEERKVKTFWNIASEAGIRCGITGWWATWPAEPVEGWLVSDAVAWHSFGVNGRSHPEEGKTWPWELIGTVEDLMPDPAAIGDDLMTRLIHLPAGQVRYDHGAGTYENPINHLRQALATSRGFTDLTLDRLESDRPQVMSVYYEGTDAVTHLYSPYQDPKLPWIPDEDHAAYRDVLDEYWKWQDELLGELLAERGPQTTVMVVSDHGFRRGAERRKQDHFHIETADEDHMPDGVIIVNGPRIRPGARIEGADIYDVTPTILHLLGLPVGRDMTGHPLTQALLDEDRRENPVAWVQTHDAGDRERGSSGAAARGGQDLEKMLRSLGYLGGAEKKSASAGDGAWEQTVNLATVLMNQDRTGEAVKVLRELDEQNPGVYEIRLNLAQALVRDGRQADGAAVYEKLLLDFPDRLETYEDYGLDLRRKGEFGRAAEVYDQALARSGTWIPALAGKGVCIARLGRPDEGRRLLEKARNLDPSDSEVHRSLGLLLRDAGDLQGALASLRQARRLEPTDYRIVSVQAEIERLLGDLDAAEKTLNEGLAKGAERRHLLGTLGAVQLQAGDLPQAERTLSEAHRLNPHGPEILGNLGMAQALGGSLDRAITTFQDLVRMEPEMAAAHAQLGVMQVQAGQVEDGVESLRQAVELEPENPAYHTNLGHALRLEGQYAEAEEELRKAHSIE